MTTLYELGIAHERVKARHYKRDSVDNEVVYLENELQYIHASIGKMLRIYKMDSTWTKVIDDLLDVNKYNELLFQSLQRRTKFIIALRDINEELVR